MLRVLNPRVDIEPGHPTPANRALQVVAGFDPARLEETIARLQDYVDACQLQPDPAMDPWVGEEELELRLAAL